MRTQLRAWARPALAGLLAAGLALGASELVTGIFASGPSLLVAVGNLVIDVIPQPVETFGIALFGEHDKLALVITMVIAIAALGAGLGVVSLRRVWIGQIGFVAFGLLGAFASARSPLTSIEFAVLTAAIAAATGGYALGALVRLAGEETRARASTTQPTEAPTRRAFLRASAAAAVITIATAGFGRTLIERSRALAASLGDMVLPRPQRPAGPPPAGASPDVPGLDPIVTPNVDFYRVDTAITIPLVDLETWKLRLTGMVERPFEISIQDLLAMPMVERYVTLSCVSNEVGGDLVDNAKWLGVPLTDLLDRAGVRAGATQVVGRSVDGFTVGFPTEVASDGRVAMVAVGMNDEPLPLEHGFPARLVVAGLYGYVSATKWLSEIELNTLDGFRAYWIPRGWAQQAPIKTQSRIDVPRRGATLTAGRHPVAGIAWAPNLGIRKVEIQVDDGPWIEAELASAISKDTWVQWVYRWDATPGTHDLRVRATDAAGETQTSTRSRPAPNGATGHHTIQVDVR